MSSETSQQNDEATPNRPVRIRAEVVENRDEGGVNRRLRLRAHDWPGSRPGQFAMLSPGALFAAGGFDPLLPRPMALFRESAVDAASELEILYKIHGRGTALLAEALPGQVIGLVGPLGIPFPEPEQGERAILVGGGTGIASLFDLAQRALGRTGGADTTSVLLGARNAIDLLGVGDFEALGVDLRCATEDGSRGHSGRVTDLLRQALDEDPDARVYVCGPTAMMRACAEIALSHEASCSVSLENGMACGFGVCLGCAAPVGEVGYQLVCCEGPVFDARQVRWEEIP
ncbi:MAG: dihydroorotate dehydrogenase electron transfer subunit [Myxococcota bacterium]